MDVQSTDARTSDKIVHVATGRSLRAFLRRRSHHIHGTASNDARKGRIGRSGGKALRRGAHMLQRAVPVVALQSMIHGSTPSDSVGARSTGQDTALRIAS